MTRKTTYAIVCPGFGGSGAVANVAMHHARELARSARIFVVSDSFPEQRVAGVEPVAIDPPTYQWLRRFGHVPREWHFTRAARKALRDLALAGGLDAVMCHGHPVAALSAAPIKRRFGVPYALVTHGDIFDRPAGTYDPRLTRFYRWVTPRAYRDSDLIIALSPYIKSLAAKRAGTKTRIEVVPNGVDLAEIGLDDIGQNGTNHAIPVLLYVGRLAPEKGVPVLIDALHELSNKGIACELRVIGDGPLRSTLEKQVKAYKLDNVVFLGAQPRIGLGRHYRDADVVCLPSLSDTLPTVALEALAAGRPVLGTNTGGIPFVVEHRKTGLVVPVGDPGALCEAIVQLLSDPSLRHQMSKAARITAKQRFDWSKIGERLRTLLCEVVRPEYKANLA